MFPVRPLPEHLANTEDKLPLFFGRKRRADTSQIKATSDEASQQVYYRAVRSGFDWQGPRRTAASGTLSHQETGKGFLKASSAEFQLQVGSEL